MTWTTSPFTMPEMRGRSLSQKGAVSMRPVRLPRVITVNGSSVPRCSTATTRNGSCTRSPNWARPILTMGRCGSDSVRIGMRNGS